RGAAPGRGSGRSGSRARRPGGVRTSVLPRGVPLVDQLLVLGVGLGELAGLAVHRDGVEPAVVGGLQGALARVLARVADRAGPAGCGLPVFLVAFHSSSCFWCSALVLVNLLVLPSIEMK